MAMAAARVARDMACRHLAASSRALGNELKVARAAHNSSAAAPTTIHGGPTIRARAGGGGGELPSWAALTGGAWVHCRTASLPAATARRGWNLVAAGVRCKSTTGMAMTDTAAARAQMGLTAAAKGGVAGGGKGRAAAVAAEGGVIASALSVFLKS